MKKTFILLMLTIAIQVKAQIFVGEKCSITFFSETKMENIDATNTVTKPVLNTATGNFAIKASQTAFIFKSAFMQEHYNENYMESEKFPFATFVGKIEETIDYTKNGTYPVTIKGKLDLHGVELPRTITGTLTVKDGRITMNSKFNVKVADHKVKVPSLYVDKIAENIEITFHSEMVPYKK
ncbi:MAG: YceI family protein [Bacteroidetes bacterium]|nr:YceI family protein [Bacteroidota bacterium]